MDNFNGKARLYISPSQQKEQRAPLIWRWLCRETFEKRRWAGTEGDSMDNPVSIRRAIPSLHAPRLLIQSTKNEERSWSIRNWLRSAPQLPLHTCFLSHVWLKFFPDTFKLHPWLTLCQSQVFFFPVLPLLCLPRSRHWQSLVKAVQVSFCLVRYFLLVYIHI